MSEPTRLSLVAVKRSVFQGVASMALPAFTIHTAVRQAGRQFAKSSNMTVKRWGPTMVGIGLVPALPFLFDHPVGTAVDRFLERCTYLSAGGVRRGLDFRPGRGNFLPEQGASYIVDAQDRTLENGELCILYIRCMYFDRSASFTCHSRTCKTICPGQIAMTQNVREEVRSSWRHWTATSKSGPRVLDAMVDIILS